MIHSSAPGKLFFSGEWAVLEVGNPGLVVSVDKRVHVELEKADEISISVEDFDIKEAKAKFEDGEIEFSGVTQGEKDKLKFTKYALESVLSYVEDYEPFKMNSWGELSQIRVDGELKKIGFGSSASSTVATIAGILSMNGYDVTDKDVRDKIYKLGAIAHYLAQGKVGSGFDIAASTYGGVFVYQRFDPDWLIEQMDSGKSIREIVEMDWPSFRAEPLEVPEDFELSIGWTGESASTSDMIRQMHNFRDSHPDEYDRLYGEIADLVEKEAEAWNSGDKEKALELLQKNEEILRELGEKSGVNIETPELKELSEIAREKGGAGKLSGAGGGDCGIGVCFSKDTRIDIEEAWEEAGLKVLDASIAREGVQVEK